jgi:hypothetical protein
VRYNYVPGSTAAHDASLVSPAQQQAPPAAYRILVPARELTAAERKRLPDVTRLAELFDPRGGVYAGLTYAMAEEIATATLIESVALRFVLADGRRGVALWWDWRWHGAIIREIGMLTREHLEAVITGAPWPPPLLPCPRCETPVRRNKDGSTRAHPRPVWHPPLTERCL